MSTRGQGRYYEEEPDPAGQHSTPSELFDMLLNTQRQRDAEHHTEETDTLYIANTKGEDDFKSYVLQIAKGKKYP